jgi:hypothetical protein
MDNSNLALFSYKMPGVLLCFFRICNFVRAPLWMLPPKHSTGKIKCNSFIRAIACLAAAIGGWLLAGYIGRFILNVSVRVRQKTELLEERRGIDDRWPKISSWDPEEWRGITSSCIDLIMYPIILYLFFSFKKIAKSFNRLCLCLPET